MKTSEQLIKLLYDLYQLEWDDMEEYFEAANALIYYHGAKWKWLKDVKDDVRKNIYEAMGFEYKYKLSIADYDQYELNCEKNTELRDLRKYDDSQEAWRELINYHRNNSFDTFTDVCYKFITFKTL